MEATVTSRVLVIGPGRAIRDKLRLSGKLDGCEIDSVENGLRALGRLRRQEYDVVVTDPETSVDDDLVLLEEMRHVRPSARVVFLVPEMTSLDVASTLRAHAFACFSAPIDFDELAEAVRQGLEASDWQDGIRLVSATETWIELQAASRMLTADRLVRFVNELQADIERTDREALVTVFREILLNAMEHGAGFDADQVVEIAIVRTRDAVLIRFRDPGTGFDIRCLEHAAISNPLENPIAHIEVRELKGLRPGGFGLLLAERLVDEVIFNERGNEALVVKKIARRIDSSAA